MARSLRQCTTHNSPLALHSQGATLPTPAFPNTNVTTCAPSDTSPPFIPITYENVTSGSQEQGGRRQGGGGLVSKAKEKLTSWFG